MERTQRRDHRLRAARHAGQQVPHAMGAAALPRRAGQNTGDRCLEPFVRVGDDELHAGEATRHEGTQERAPPGAVLGRDHVDAEHLSVAVCVHPDRDNDRHVHDAARFADLLAERVQPHIRVRASIQRPVPERIDARVEALSELTHLRLRQARDPHRLGDVFHPARRNALHVALRDDRDHRLFRPPSRLQQELREVAALPELRDRELDRAHPRIPGAVPIAVPTVRALRASFPVPRVALRLRVRRHQLLRERSQHRPDQIRIRLRQVLAQPLQRVHHVRDCHRAPPHVAWSLHEVDAVAVAFGGPSAAQAATHVHHARGRN